MATLYETLSRLNIRDVVFFGDSLGQQLHVAFVASLQVSHHFVHCLFKAHTIFNGIAEPL